MEKQLKKVYPNEVVFTLIGSIPPKKNSKQIFRNKKTGRPFVTSSENYKAWERVAAMQIRSQMKGKGYPIKEVESIWVTLYYGNKIRKDNTNTVEGVHDLLVSCGVLEDDRWEVLPETHQIAVYRKDNAGAEISIRIPI